MGSIGGMGPGAMGITLVLLKSGPHTVTSCFSRGPCHSTFFFGGEKNPVKPIDFRLFKGAISYILHLQLAGPQLIVIFMELWDPYNLQMAESDWVTGGYFTPK